MHITVLMLKCVAITIFNNALEHMLWFWETAIRLKRFREKFLNSQVSFSFFRLFHHFQLCVNAGFLASRQVSRKHSDQAITFKDSTQSIALNLPKKYYHESVVSNICYFDIYICEYLPIFLFNRFSQMCVNNQSMSCIRLFFK